LAVLEKEKTKQTCKEQASSNKAKFAQFFTPEPVANFMVGMFSDTSQTQVSILDPGAGEGILGVSLFNKLLYNGTYASMALVEIDERVFQVLKRNTRKEKCMEGVSLINGDFVKEAFAMLHQNKRFSHVIMNPPYYKLRRGDEISDYLLSCGVNATNIYAAFMWLGLLLLEDGGQLVAIVPRSFCNGPYFLKFREFIAKCASIEAIHTFFSRDKVFSKDQVLQENVIIRFVKGAQSKTVKVSYSSDQSFIDVKHAEYQANEVFNKNDPDLTISIPSYSSREKLNDYVCCSLTEIGLEVSTGPVVDFRLKDSISKNGVEGSVPLLYPIHMRDGQITWPLESMPKKGQYYLPQPNLLEGVDPACQGDKNVSPKDGFYVIVRRFSSKEEKRRIYAAVVDSSRFDKGVAFENHLNYFHIKKHGFDRELAYGLSVYLNSSLLDEHFRTFSGHTQVNATDLRNIPYPTEKQLRRLGQIALEEPVPFELIITPDLLRGCA